MYYYWPKTPLQRRWFEYLVDLGVDAETADQEVHRMWIYDLI